MRSRSNVLALVVVLGALALVLNDPVMDVVFVDRDGIGTELAL
ncbi:MAG TPA: hypothetical protein VF365_04865 [Candidatus Limnocylindria bacterium]